MKQLGKIILKKVLPSVLVTVLIFNLLPLPCGVVYAEELEQIQGVSVQPYEGIYDGNEHEAVTVTGTWEGDLVEYKLDGGEWTTSVPLLIKPGTYTVSVRITRDNHETKEITAINVVINKAEQSFSFNNYSGTNTTDIITNEITEKTYDFNASDEQALAGGTITYSVTFGEDDDGIATIDSDGLLKVTDAGTVYVSATLSGNEYYNSCTITHSLSVFLEANAEGALMNFSTPGVSYILGENGGMVASQTAVKKYRRDKGKITYSIDKENIGLSCNASTGEVTVSDYDLLSECMYENGGTVYVIVTADKARTSRYGKDTVSYMITISFFNTPTETYIADGTVGENEWYISDVVLTPVDVNYMISKSAIPDKFTATTSVNELGTGYIYLRNSTTGGITNRIFYDEIKIDTISPVINVEYNEASNVINSIQYYKENIVATITVIEENFVAQNVKVMVEKDQGAPYETSVIWNEAIGNEITGTFEVPVKDDGSCDGDYTITITCKDEAGRELEETYVSEMFRVDTMAPIITVEYENPQSINTLTDKEGNIRNYYNTTQTVIVTIEDRSLDADDIKVSFTAKDIAGSELDVENLSRQSEWINEDIKYTKTIVCEGDANYRLDIECIDLLGNLATLENPGCFTVDKTEPTNMSVTYGTSVWENILETISFGYYNAQTTVTITADDPVSGIGQFLYSYKNAPNVSSVNAEVINQPVSAQQISYSNNGITATYTFQIPRDALGGNNQFNGTIHFIAKNNSGIESTYYDTKRIVVDNISPTVEVDYSVAVQTQDNISYYDGDITGTVVINEANFFSQDVEVLVSKDGAMATAVNVDWRDNSIDIHVGTFVLSGDGEYEVSVNYTDKSKNVMQPYLSGKMIIDTNIEQPVILINGESESGCAFKGEVVPEISFSDANFEDYEVTLTRTRYGQRDIDVTKEFVEGNIVLNETGGHGTFDKFNENIEYDGIYTLTVSIRDKAGHTSETTNIFTVNRFGSVYEYDNYLAELVADGGAYVTEITQDLIITEYNADRLISDSLNIEITCDGKPIDDVNYTVNPTIENTVEVGDSGWFQYEYVISKQNFTTDGVYKIAVSSQDATGNIPENSKFEDKAIIFRVDNTCPEITSVVGLEKNIINAQEVEIKYEIYDTIGLKSVTVCVNGQQLGDSVMDFGEDSNNYSGSFVLQEATSKQKVQIIVEDLAGNIVDTDSQSFTSVYAFNDMVTISTNVFIRFWANKPLAFGCLAGIVVIGGATGTLMFYKRKRNK